MEIRLESQAARQVGSRSGVYALLARAFAFPSEALFAEVASGSFGSRLREASQDLPGRLDLDGDLGRGVGQSYDDLQSGYLAHFELGGPEGPAVPLYEGHHGGGLLRDMEEVLRLYHHFGFRYTGGFRPDHLQTELEFLHALTFSEAAAPSAGADARLYRQAQRDFVHYHLGGLVSHVEQGMRGRTSPFYPELARLLSKFVDSEAEVLGLR